MDNNKGESMETKSYLTPDQVQQLNEKHGWFEYGDAQSDVSNAFAQDAIAMYERVRAAAPDLLAVVYEARANVQANRETLYESHYQAHTGDLDAEGRVAVDAEDALLSRIDAAIAKATGAA